MMGLSQINHNTTNVEKKFFTDLINSACIYGFGFQWINAFFR